MMKTYKILEKPSGIFGIAFEDLGLLSTFSLTTFFLINLLNIWFPVSGWFFLVAIALVLCLFLLIKKSNKEHKPQYLLSRIAWLRTPRVIRINFNSILDDPD